MDDGITGDAHYGWLRYGDPQHHGRMNKDSSITTRKAQAGERHTHSWGPW